MSVIIPTRNRSELLLQTLRAVLSSDVRPLEVIVVDQSDDEPAQATWQAIKQAAADDKGPGDAAHPLSHENDTSEYGHPHLTADLGHLRYIRSQQRGASSARNTGAAAARGGILLFIDDDVLVDGHCIAVTEKEYQRDPQVVAVYGRILPYTGESGAQRRSGTEVVRVGVERKIYRQPTNPWHLGSGGNMSFRTDVFRAVGGFDEVLGAGAPLESWEDLDIGHRMLTRGLGAVVYAPDSLAYHDSPKAFAVQLATEKGYGVGAGAAFYKYWRCGDGPTWTVLRNWIWHMAVRRLGAGLFKWRNWQVVRLALLQFWYPLVGIARAHDWPIDRDTGTFIAAEAASG